jgi:hypothetical protein
MGTTYAASCKRTSQNAVKAKFRGSAPPTVARLPLMSEEERPTGIQYEDAVEAAKLGGNVDFEGRKVRVVSISARTGMETPYSARLDLDLGDEYVVLLGYFRGGEFIEEGRERPFGEAT